MGKQIETLAWRGSHVARSLVALVMMFLASKTWQKLANKPTSNVKEQVLIDWVLSHGAVVNAEIGKACTSCPRGLIATRDLKPASLILRIPETAMIKFPYIKHSAFAAVSYSFYYILKKQLRRFAVPPPC
jgi:hypothetical protein